MGQGQTSRNFWVRQAGNVQGPFEESRVHGWIAQGRLRVTMEFSTDGEHFSAGSEWPELFGGVPRPAMRVPPIPTPIAVVATPVGSSDEVQCPDCAELIRPGARKCKHCGAWVARGSSALRQASRKRTGYEPRAVLGLAGGVLLLLACFGPWLDIAGVVQIRGIALLDGKMVAILGVLAMVAGGIALSSRAAGARWPHLVAGFLAAAACIRFFIRLQQVLAREIHSEMARLGSWSSIDLVGWGLYLSFLATAMLIVAGLVAERPLDEPHGGPARRRGRPRSRRR